MTRSAFESFDLPESTPSLSNSLYSDASFTSSLSDFKRPQPTAVTDQLGDNPYAAYGEINDAPLLSPAIKQQLDKAEVLQFSTPVDNQAAGEQPDYRAVVGTDGQLRLEPVGDGDPLADGKINIQSDPNNKSLAEAIKNADNNR